MKKKKMKNGLGDISGKKEEFINFFFHILWVALWTI